MQTEILLTDKMVRGSQWPTGIALVLIHVGALLAFFPRFFSWSALAIALVLYYVTGGLGVCLGYHRLLTHRSLNVPKWFEYFLATMGALALQGDPITWISTHRAHHAYSDTPRDPHDANRGFWWSHCFWLVAPNPARLTPAEIQRFGVDLLKDPYYRALRYLTPIFSVILAIGLYGIGGWSWVIWGMFVRLVIVYHITWLVNSAAHEIGYRTYSIGNLATNNWLVGFLAWGEGWHNNHHAFPASARHGLRWYEFDATYLVIRVLSLFGLARKIRLPSTMMLIRGPILREQPTSPPKATTSSCGCEQTNV